MASMDWFRWHHGSVTDPKFQLISRKSGCSVAEVIGFWAFLLESASMNDARGCIGNLDFESIDCALGLQDGKSHELYALMVSRGLVDDDEKAIHSWMKRQPVRERDDDKSTERVRAFRERQRHETPCNASETPCNAKKRLEEIREDKNTNTPPPPKGELDVVDQQPGQQNPGQPDNPKPPVKPQQVEFTPGFAEFWKTWPNTDRKQARSTCYAVWKKAKLEADAAVILSHVCAMKNSESWKKDDGQFVPAPVVYLRGKRWDGAEVSALENNSLGVFL